MFEEYRLDGYIFFFKQKTAYEMRISDGVQTCALPIFHIAGHDVRPPDRKPPAFLDPRHIVQPRLYPRQQPSDRSGAEMHRGVDRDHRPRFRRAIAEIEDSDKIGRAHV